MKKHPEHTAAVTLVRLALSGFAEEQKRAVCDEAIKKGDHVRKAGVKK